MPIYEYECTTNQHRFEVIQRFDDPPVTHCTVCGDPVHKLLSSPAIQFKGTGWYITDYARKGQSTSEKSDANAPKTESKSTDTSKDKSSSATTSTGDSSKSSGS